MKRLVVAGAFVLTAAGQVLAADLPQPGAPPPQAPVAYMPAPQAYNWAGLYFGLNAGGAWVDQPGPSFATGGGAAIPGTSTAANSTGFAGGGQLGLNLQSGQFVYGLEADADYLSNKSTLNGSESAGGLVASTFTHTYQLDLLTTVVGRFGYAFDRALLYGTAGLAMGEFEATRTQNTCPLFCPGTSVPGTNESYSTLRLGWTAGAGFEYAFADNWTTRLEYLYASLQSVNYTFPIANRTTSAPAESVNLVRAGVNYKFAF